MGCSKAWNAFAFVPFLCSYTVSVHTWETSWHRLHDARRRCAPSPSRPRPPQCPHAHSNGSKFPQKNRSHLIPTLIPTLLIKEGRAARGSRIRDPDPRRSLPHWGTAPIAAYVLICRCTMRHVLSLRYPGLLFGAGQRVALLRNKGKKASRKAKAVTARAHRDYQMGQTASSQDSRASKASNQTD